MNSTELANALKSVFGPLGYITDMLTGQNHDMMMKILKLISRVSLRRVLRALTAEEASFWATIKVVPFEKKKLIPVDSSQNREFVQENQGKSIAISKSAIELIDSPHFCSPTEENHYQFALGTFSELFGPFTEVQSISHIMSTGLLAHHGYTLCEPSDMFAIAKHISQGTNSFDDSTATVLVLAPRISDSQDRTENLFAFMRCTSPGVYVGVRTILDTVAITSESFSRHKRCSQWIVRRRRDREITD